MQNVAVKFAEQIKKVFPFQTQKAGKTAVLFLLGTIGLLLIVLPPMFEAKEEKIPQPVEASQHQASKDYALYLSERLEEILGKMKGVGNVKVMVTLNREEEMVYATDFLSDSHSQNDDNQQKTDRKHVLLEKDGQEEALVTTRITPRVQGVIIVCDGGNDPIVIKKLTDAVTASLGIGANRVAVLSSVSNQ